MLYVTASLLVIWHFQLRKVLLACNFFAFVIHYLCIFLTCVSKTVDVCLPTRRLHCSDGQLPQPAPALC